MPESCAGNGWRGAWVVVLLPVDRSMYELLPGDTMLDTTKWKLGVAEGTSLPIAFY